MAIKSILDTLERNPLNDKEMEEIWDDIRKKGMKL